MSRERNSGIRWSLWIGALAWSLVFVSTAAAARRAWHFVTSDPQFRLSAERRDLLTIEGLRHASRARVLRVFAPDFGRSVFLVPLAERRRRLLAIDWVEDASVSRAWPNRLVVRIRERTPVAFVNLPWSLASRESRVALIDGHGVLLDPPPQSRFAFPVLSGVSEEQPEPERRERVRAMLRLLEDVGPLAPQISEINVEMPDNLKIITQVEGRAVELLLGDGNYRKRFSGFLTHYADIRRRSGGATAFDLRLDDHIVAKQTEPRR